MQFLNDVETEAAGSFARFLKSEDRAAKFPSAFLDVRGVAMLQLLDHKVQLEKMLDISDYAKELLSQAQPAPGRHSLHTLHDLLETCRPRPSFVCHLGPQSS